MHFFKSIAAEQTSPSQPALGHLETTVMDLLWERGESNVHDVVQHVGRPLAYTTVMTTLDRLFKKGLLTAANPPAPSSILPAGRAWNGSRSAPVSSSRASSPGRSQPASCSFPAWWMPSASRTKRFSMNWKRRSA